MSLRSFHTFDKSREDKAPRFRVASASESFADLKIMKKFGDVKNRQCFSCIVKSTYKDDKGKTHMKVRVFDIQYV